VAWDENLGAEKLDLILLNYFADEFQEKHGVDIRASPKAVAKLKRQVLTLGTYLGTAEYLV
jgi:hypoxia up-regulated 1